jgi:1-acyl-sn-glycerol-3-phosphate acyltransferase
VSVPLHRDAWLAPDRNGKKVVGLRRGQPPSPLIDELALPALGYVIVLGLDILSRPGTITGTITSTGRTAVNQRKLGFWYRLAVVVLRPPLMVFTRRDWQGGEVLRDYCGVIVVANHISYADPLACAHFVHDAGRAPRFLAKSELFRLPLAGRLLAGADQIPVYRESKDAVGAFRAAVRAVEQGECVVIYPEGTLTRDPDLWPMTGKTGAARIALETGAPVIPVGQWGAHELLPAHQRLPRLLPRRTLRFRVGPPVDLSDYAGKEATPQVLRGATERIMAAITVLVGELRGEIPPARSVVAHPPEATL